MRHPVKIEDTISYLQIQPADFYTAMKRSSLEILLHVDEHDENRTGKEK